MTETTQRHEEEKRADFTLPSGCIACGGDLEIRLTPGNAYGYCAACHTLSKPHVELSREGFRVGPAIQHFA
jgi:hypothetical protein